MCYTGQCRYEITSGPDAGDCTLQCDLENYPDDAGCVVAVEEEQQREEMQREESRREESRRYDAMREAAERQEIHRRRQEYHERGLY